MSQTLTRPKSLFDALPPSLRRQRGIGGRRPSADLPAPQGSQWELDGAITVVLFAGLGGACQGLEDAGCPVDVACNHDEVAIAAHAAIHPHTRHIKGDLFDVDPVAATRGRRVKRLWASPDCTHFSVALGAAPRSPRVRSLPWQVCRWMGEVRPETVFIENVREIRKWSPLIARRCQETGRVMKIDGTVAAKGERVPVRDQQLVPDKKRVGQTFRQWVRHIRALGYQYEDRDMNCADYGVPTTRRRYFGVARCDGQMISWPAQTHAPREEAEARGLQPWVAASTIIDWSVPLPSIFSRKKPLAEATQRRIAVGLQRYVLDNPRPFIVPVCHTGRGDSRVSDGAVPLPTMTTAKGGEFAVAKAKLVPTWEGKLPGEAQRLLDMQAPAAAPGPGAPKHAAVAAWMAQHNTGLVGHPMEAPLSTMTCGVAQQQVGAAFLAKLRGTSTAASAEAPCPTLSAGGNHVGPVAAFLTKFYRDGGQHQGCSEPLHTLSTKARFGLVTVDVGGQEYVVADIGMRMLEPHEAAAAHELRIPREIVVGGKRRALTKTEAMRLIGNSVPRRMARLLAQANPAHALTSPVRAAA